MARSLRIEFEGAFYHTTSRGNPRDRIFFDDKDRETFLEILRRTKERYGYMQRGNFFSRYRRNPFPPAFPPVLGEAERTQQLPGKTG